MPIPDQKNCPLATCSWPKVNPDIRLITWHWDTEGLENKYFQIIEAYDKFKTAITKYPELSERIKVLIEPESPLKGLSIEFDNGIIGMGLWRFVGSRGLGITFWAPPYPKIGDGRIYSRFSSPSGPPPLPHCICSGSNPTLVETR